MAIERALETADLRGLEAGLRAGVIGSGLLVVFSGMHLAEKLLAEFGWGGSGGELEGRVLWLIVFFGPLWIINFRLWQRRKDLIPRSPSPPAASAE